MARANPPPPSEATESDAAATGAQPALAGQALVAGESPQRTCLVLSGGGARGAAHIGVLKVLEEMRVPIDCIVGTSMGAIVGASWASGVSLERMEKSIRDAHWDVVLGDQPDRPRRSIRSKELERLRVACA